MRRIRGDPLEGPQDHGMVKQPPTFTMDDSTGYVQPSVQDIQKVRAIVGFVQHHNAIQPWSVNAKGEVRNVIGQA
jgi:hypothetical protein